MTDTLYDDGLLYDLAHGERAGEPEAAFWARRALERGGRALELGCGTGRVTVPLAEAGVQVTGLDLSADDDQHLLVHLPADPATAAALDRLTGRRPGGLRAVSG